MNSVERYMDKLAQFVIENPMTQDDEYDYSIPIPQVGETSQIPRFIGMNEDLVRNQDPTFGLTQSEFDSEQDGDENDFYSGSSEPDNGMGMV